MIFMQETWFTLQVLWIIIPIVIIVLIFSLCFIVEIINCIKWNRKVKLLKKLGYERYLAGVASVGNGAWYGWKNDKAGKRFLESDIIRWTYKQLKEILGDKKIEWSK